MNSYDKNVINSISLLYQIIVFFTLLKFSFSELFNIYKMQIAKIRANMKNEWVLIKWMSSCYISGHLVTFKVNLSLVTPCRCRLKFVFYFLQHSVLLLQFVPIYLLTAQVLFIIVNRGVPFSLYKTHDKHLLLFKSPFTYWQPKFCSSLWTMVCPVLCTTLDKLLSVGPHCP